MLLVIKDSNDKGIVTPQLHQMLGAVQEYGPNLVWSVLDIYCELKTDSVYTIDGVDQNIGSSDYGWIMSWDELLRLADCIKWVFDCFVVGYIPESGGVSIEMDRVEMLEAIQVGIEMFDSTMWLVYCRDERVGHGCAGAFKDVTIVDGREPSGNYL